METLEDYVEHAKSLGVSRAKLVDTKNVVVRNWVRLKCQFGCGGYGACLTCPPYSPTPDYTERMMAEYSTGLLLQIENVSFRSRPRMRSKLRDLVADLEREVFLDGYHKAFGMTAGPCRICKPCDTRKLCKHPQRARPSMEACGIDVYQTARNYGFELEVVKATECPYSYVSLLLIE